MKSNEVKTPDPKLLAAMYGGGEGFDWAGGLDLSPAPSLSDTSGMIKMGPKASVFGKYFTKESPKTKLAKMEKKRPKPPSTEGKTTRAFLARRNSHKYRLRPTEEGLKPGVLARSHAQQNQGTSRLAGRNSAPQMFKIVPHNPGRLVNSGTSGAGYGHVTRNHSFVPGKGNTEKAPITKQELAKARADGIGAIPLTNFQRFQQAEAAGDPITMFGYEPSMTY